MLNMLIRIFRFAYISDIKPMLWYKNISGSTSSRAFMDQDELPYDQTLISPCTTGGIHQL